MRKGGLAGEERMERGASGPKARLLSVTNRGLRARNAKFRKRAQDRALEDYIAVVSHELRTPLTALRIHLDTALSDAKSGSESSLLCRLQSAQRQVDRLVTMVDQLLDASRMVTGKLPLLKERVDLMEIVHDVLERLAGLFDRANCEISVIGPPSVDGEWSRFGLEQVLTNLLVNATKYGCGKPIQIIVEADEHRVMLRVIDHGIGIARKDQERIFERHEQLPGPRPHGGLGLGLWIVSRIVAALDGRIHVESRLGQGAVFVVELLRGRPRGG